jgi:hypothetical protein
MPRGRVVPNDHAALVDVIDHATCLAPRAACARADVLRIEPWSVQRVVVAELHPAVYRAGVGCASVQVRSRAADGHLPHQPPVPGDPGVQHVDEQHQAPTMPRHHEAAPGLKLDDHGGCIGGEGGKLLEQLLYAAGKNPRDNRPRRLLIRALLSRRPAPA